MKNKLFDCIVKNGMWRNGHPPKSYEFPIEVIMKFDPKIDKFKIIRWCKQRHNAKLSAGLALF